MKLKNFAPAITESLRSGEYYIWKVHFTDGTSTDVKIVNDETSKESIEKHFGKSVDRIDHNWGIQGGGSVFDQEASRRYHAQQDELERRKNQTGSWLDESDSVEVPEVGDQIRTTKGQVTGVVEKISESGEVFFRIHDGRLMKTRVDNVTVIEKIIDDEMVEAIKFAPGSYPDVDHMVGAVHKYGSMPGTKKSNRKTYTEYSEWERHANDLNGELHDDNCEITSDRYSSTFTTPSGKIFAAWNKRTNTGFIDSAVTEEVDDVLEDIYKQWNKEKVNELSTTKLNQYKDAAADPANVRTMPLRKLAKHAQGVSTANSKLNARQGVKRQGPPASYEDRLAEFVGVEEAITPWGGYTKDDKKANALAKAPKSSMQGSVKVPFSQMVQDTIKQHGIKWAFQYYVVKHGLPPRHFRIFAGI